MRIRFARSSRARTAWAGRVALALAALFIAANALVALRTAHDVTAAEAAVVDSQAVRLELAALLEKRAAFERTELDERFARLDQLTSGDQAHQRDLAQVRDLVRAGAPFPKVREVVVRMNAREQASLSAREAELHAARRVDTMTTLVSLVIGLVFIAATSTLLERRARADRRAAEALRASEERLRLFIEHAPASLAMFDRDMRYVSASRRWVKGRDFFDSMLGLDPFWRKAHERALAGEVMGNDLERVERAGRVRWLRWELRPWFEEIGKIGGVIAIVEDITERRKTEEARDRAVEQARHADRLATVGRLAAGVAHEIGTPLSVASGHAEMIATEEVRGEMALKSARTILSQLERVSRIVRQLLDFSRRRAPAGESAAETVDVAAVVKRTIELLRSTASKRSIRLEAKVEDGLRAEILGEEEAITQMLTNLVMNAIHASHDGGTITASVDVTPEAEVRIRVQDEGTGMPPEVRDHIFDPFFTTKLVGDGTGLGLSVVHGIVQDHRGAISVETAIDEGTTFTVVLPQRP